jgi:hypothetical protein
LRWDSLMISWQVRDNDNFNYVCSADGLPGGLTVELTRFRAAGDEAHFRTEYDRTDSPADRLAPRGSLWHRLGIYATYSTDAQSPIEAAQSEGVFFGDNAGTVALELPYWLLAVLFAVLPMRWMVLARRAGRGRVKACSECGCNRRTERNRCPDCGDNPI